MLISVRISLDFPFCPTRRVDLLRSERRRGGSDLLETGPQPELDVQYVRGARDATCRTLLYSTFFLLSLSLISHHRAQERNGQSPPLPPLRQPMTIAAAVARAHVLEVAVQTRASSLVLSPRRRLLAIRLSPGKYHSTALFHVPHSSALCTNVDNIIVDP
jgi:hypothetical protein